ncbi:MAG: hypothetical protein OZ921_09065 [Sorangiineae bacterium]|nr:hypothetical protein [Polyangiaceae bacterium]MEB2322652.1 hypothetical protein [Sorangiineae bacterium]
MSRLFLIAAAGCALVGAASCREKPELVLRDTEGRAFRTECNGSGQCQLEQTSGPAAPPGKSVAVLRARASLVGVCDVASGSSEPERGDCRALLCERDEGCPPAHDLSHGSCIGGYCSEPSHELGVDDAVMLCLAGTGLGRASPEQVERYALALNCGSPCRVPTPCRPR